MVKHALYSSNINSLVCIYSSNIESLVCLLPHAGAIDVIDHN